MPETALHRAVTESARRLDEFDAHAIPSEEFRRAVYTLYEIIRELHAGLRECEKEFQDAYDAFTRIAEKTEAARTRDMLGALLEEPEEKANKEVAEMLGGYL